MISYIYIIIIVAMFIWVFRSNKKAQKQNMEMQKSLRPGMYVMLRDGFYGTIVDVLDRDVVINFSTDGADEGCLTVGKDSIYEIVEQAAGNAIAPVYGRTSKAEDTAEPGSIAERLAHAAAVEAAEDEEEADETAALENTANTAEGNSAEEAAAFEEAAEEKSQPEESVKEAPESSQTAAEPITEANEVKTEAEEVNG